MSKSKPADKRLSIQAGISPIEPETIHIPAGPFLMGSSDDDEFSWDDEKPQHTTWLGEYWIGRYQVTNREYKAFVQNVSDDDIDSIEHIFPKGKGDHPVVIVSWRDANGYCVWLSEMTGKTYRLPTEAQWEKAARGEDGRIYPWGNAFDSGNCNTLESKIGGTTPVGHYSPAGDSPYGCADMTGNVWEWTSSLWHKDEQGRVYGYPFEPADGRERLDAPPYAIRITRGGSWSYSHTNARVARRYHSHPNFESNRNGFRVVVLPS